MRNKKAHLTFSLLLILATIGFIWINSALPGSSSGQFSGWFRNVLSGFLGFVHCPEGLTVYLLDHVRKVAHALEYAVIGGELAILWVGLNRGFQGFWNSWSTALAIAVYDETIQLFATSRGPQIQDVILDTVSASIAILLVYIIFGIAACIKNWAVKGGVKAKPGSPVY